MTRITVQAFGAALLASLCVLPRPGAAVDAAKEADLSARMRHWSAPAQLPFCDYREGKFPSKYKLPEKPGALEGPACEDGDSVIFNGLTCATGDRRGCAAVLASQGPNGLWWRSPRRRVGRIIDPEGKETIFSNDHALGAMLYILETRNSDAFKNWITWIGQNGRYLGHIPRYCDDDRCAFKPIDCPLLDRVALAIGQANPVCDPSPLDPNALLNSLQRAFDDVTGELDHIPGADVLMPDRKILKALFDETMGPLQKITARAEELRQKHDTFLRAMSHVSDVVTLVNSEVNDAGYPRHDVGVAAYLLLKYGGFNTDAVSDAAHIIAAKEPENAFFEYLAHGPTPRMLDQILAKCPSATEDKLHARFQWIWEREDREPDPSKPQPWTQTMYWDCLFVANLYRAGSLTGAALDVPPGFDELYRLAEQERARLEAIIRDVISQANALKSLALLGPQVVLAAGQAMVDLVNEVAGILARDKELALLNEISGKLDIVLNNQKRILQEIEALKIYVQESFRNEVINTMNSLASSYASLSKDRSDKTHRPEYVQFHDRVVEVAGSLGQRDTPAYIAYSAGVTIALTIQHLYPDYFSRSRFEETRKKFKQPYDRWLDSSNPESIVTIISATKKGVGDRVAALNARPRTVVYYTESEGCSITTTVTISGDLNSGFTGRSSTDRYCPVEPDPCVKRPAACFIGDENVVTERAVRRKLLGLLGIAVSGHELNEVPIPVFSPSGIGVVDDMNRERIAIFEAMSRLARQEIMQDQMMKARDALAASLP